ncbi:FMN-binding protein [Streptomyces sp. NPDC046727]|uniref:FMN-binding protein n=1 Tax=Streptomyces sp. NPDC046727 TaxID=3155373 RepID=UPI0033CC624D
MRRTIAAVIGTAAATGLLTTLKLGMAPVGADASSTAGSPQPGEAATIGTPTSPPASAPSASSPGTCPAAFTGSGAAEPAAYVAAGDDDGGDGDHHDEGDDGGDDARATPAPTNGTTGTPTGTSTPPPTPTAAAPSVPCTSAPPAAPIATPAPSSTATRTGLKNGTFRGPAARNEYGTIQTTITVSGGRITDVTAGFPTTPARSAQINAKAIPALRQEALAAQSATIDAVSGASFTSTSYKESLQAAIDAAKA